MTTLISNPEASLVAPATAEAPARAAAEHLPYRAPHTLASRFVFLTLCVAMVLTALAYGTVHYWALAVFSLGACAILVLWTIDSWKLGTLRISRNVLQLPILGLFALGCIQLLPLRHPEGAGVFPLPTAGSVSLDPYSTRLVLVQLAALMS